MKYHGISFELISHDQYYDQMVAASVVEGGQAPMVINDIVKGRYFPERGIDTVAKLSVLLQNQITDDVINDAPICSVVCDSPIGNRYNIGKTCPSCGTVVTERRLRTDMWIETPVAESWFVNPRFWMLFNHTVGGFVFSKFERDKSIHRNRGNDLMLWMIDPTYRMENLKNDSRVATAIEILSEIGYVRDVVSLHDNFDRVMSTLASPENWVRLFKVPQNNIHGIRQRELDRERFLKIIREQRHAIFSKKLPIIPTKLIVSEINDGKLKVDPVYQALHDVAKGIAELYYFTNTPPKHKSLRRMSKINKLMAYFYSDYRKESLEQKTGEYRGKLSRTYVAFSGRATITPISGVHDPLKLVAPWRWFVNLMKVDIASKLKRRGYSRRQSKKIILYASMQHHDEVADILRELIRESPGGLGILVLPLRNPTLVQLAVQALWIDDFETDVNQCSLRISVNVIKMANGDFDGDQLMVWRPIGQEEYDLAQHHRPDQGFMSAETADEVAHGMILHNELISMQNSYLRKGVDEDEHVGVSLDSL